MHILNKEQNEVFLSVVKDFAKIFEFQIIQTSLSEQNANRGAHDDSVEYAKIIRFINNYLSFNQSPPYVLLKDSSANHNISLVIPIKKQIWEAVRPILIGGWYLGDFDYFFENVWDIDDIQKQLEKSSDKTKAKEIFDKLDQFSNEYLNIHLVSKVFYPYNLKDEYGKVSNWRGFEKFVNKFVEVYFEGYIGKLEEQESTDECLQRYDAIASLSYKKNETPFFEILKNCFNCRYLVFEAKYYQKSITQNEIWRTSKYLYKTALRSVAIVFTSSEYADDGAKITQKGLLREQGKLILVVDKNDIEKLLEDRRLDIETLLKNKLDDLMIHLHA